MAVDIAAKNLFFHFRNRLDPTEFVSMKSAYPLSPPKERRLVPRAARVHALGGPFSFQFD
jgi:hypothetical protein